MIDPLLILMVIVPAGALALYLGLQRADRSRESREQRRRRWQERPADMLRASFYGLRARMLARRGPTTVTEEDIAAATKKVGDLKAELGHRADSSAFRIIVTAVAAFWAVMFCLQIYLDCMILLGLHASQSVSLLGVFLSSALGVAAAMIVSGLALVLATVFGGHGALFNPSRNVKRAIGVWIPAFLVLVIGGLALVAPARSDLTVGRQVSLATKSRDLAQLKLDAAQRRDPPSPAAVASAQAELNSASTDLAAAQSRHSSSRAFDRLYAMLVPAAEVAFSWFALAAGELLLLGMARRRLRKLSKDREQDNRSDAQLIQEWQAQRAQELTELDLTLDPLRTFTPDLGNTHHQQGQPSTTHAGPGPGPAPDPNPATPSSPPPVNDPPPATGGTAAPGPEPRWFPPPTTPPSASPPRQPLPEEWDHGE